MWLSGKVSLMIKSVTARTTCHSWKISSSRSLSFLVSLVIVRGTATWDACCCCCILEDKMTLCDLVSGRQSDVLLVQAASRAATLWRINRWEDTVSLQMDRIHTIRLTNFMPFDLKVWVLQKYQTGLFIYSRNILVPKQEVVIKNGEASLESK